MANRIKQRTAQLLELLPTFEAVAQMGSVTEGAKLLAISPATASNRIRRLEEELGVSLFRRTRRAVELSEEGAELLLRASRWFEEAEAYVGACSRDELRVHRLAAMGALDDWLIMPALSASQAAAPSLSISMAHPLEGDVNALLDRAECDLFVGVNLIASADTDHELLCVDTLGIYVGRKHPLYGADAVDLETALSYGFVALCSQPLIAPVWPGAARRTVSLRVDTHQAGIDAARAGVFNVAALDLAMQDHRDTGDLYRLPIDLGVRCKVMACWSDRRPLAADLQHLLVHLRARVAELQREAPVRRVAVNA